MARPKNDQSISYVYESDTTIEEGAIDGVEEPIDDDVDPEADISDDSTDEVVEYDPLVITEVVPTGEGVYGGGEEVPEESPDDAEVPVGIPDFIQKTITTTTHGIIENYSPEYLESLYNDGCKFFAEYSDGTEDEVLWTEIFDPAQNRISELQMEASMIGAASNQHFWDDDNGAHVTDTSRDDWNAEYDKPDHGELSNPTTSPWHNILINSLGVLLRTGLNNLNALSKSGFTIYDGLGNTVNNILASYSKDGVTIGRTSGNYFSVNSAALQFFVDGISNLWVGIQNGVANLRVGTNDGGNVHISGNGNVKVNKGSTNLAHFGYGDTQRYNETTQEIETVSGPYYTFGTRSSDGLIGYMSHAEGANVEASGMSSHAEGIATKASGRCSHAEGAITEASGVNSHAEGDNTEAIGMSSHAEGSGTKASGSESHAEGIRTEASNSYSHAEGYETKASGTSSHAEGDNTEATAGYSHAEGINTKASGTGSHAEGIWTEASNSYSHAEGSSTKASGSESHAEGSVTEAGGRCSHAEGMGTEAGGANSHAEGLDTKASGANSHAGGRGTIAEYANQTVVGKYNNNGSDNMLEVGGGTDENTRLNLFAVKTNGNIEARGTLNLSAVPSLPASRIGSGTLDADRIPSLPASKIGSGTLAGDRIPSLPASKIVSGTFNKDRIPFSWTQLVSTNGSVSSVSIDLSDYDEILVFARYSTSYLGSAYLLKPLLHASTLREVYLGGWGKNTTTSSRRAVCKMSRAKIEPLYITIDGTDYSNTSCLWYVYAR